MLGCREVSILHRNGEDSEENRNIGIDPQCEAGDKDVFTFEFPQY